jgi:membrane protein implicated in regulation of membrane protease activity
VQRTLLILGGLLILAGLLSPWASKLPLGRLPGDLVIDKPGLKFYAPFATMLILSLVVSLLLWLFRK